MNEELYHHGILGQKWGIRRFQNSDGSLTSAGKSRYGSNQNETKSNDSNAGNKKKKIAIAVGVGATIAATLAAIGGVKLVQVRNKTDAGKNFISWFFKKGKGKETITYTEKDKDLMELISLLNQVYENTDNYLQNQ